MTQKSKASHLATGRPSISGTAFIKRERMRDRKDAKIFEENIKRRNILKFVILSLILTFFCDYHLNLIKSEIYIEACKSH